MLKYTYKNFGARNGNRKKIFSKRNSKPKWTKV